MEKKDHPYAEEARKILAGQTLLLPTREHLVALQRAHEEELVEIAWEMNNLRNRTLGASTRLTR